MAAQTLRLNPQNNGDNGVRGALNVMPGVTPLRWAGGTHQRGRSDTILAGSRVTVDKGEVARCRRYHSTVEPSSLWQGLTAGIYDLLERHSDDVSEAGNAKRGVGDTYGACC